MNSGFHMCPEEGWSGQKKARLRLAIVEGSRSIYFSHELVALGGVSQQSTKEGHLGEYEG